MAEHTVAGQHIYNGNVMLPRTPPHILDRIKSFQFMPDDILLATYPKSGTTWLSQILWHIMNNESTEKSKETPIFARSLQIETSLIDKLQSMPSPRIIQTHLPYQFYEEAINRIGDSRFKIIVGMRNPKDVLTSYYHYYKMNKDFGNFNGSFTDFFEMFRENKLFYGDCFDYNLGWWDHRANPCILFVKYEDMIENPKDEITKIASFLGMDLDADVLGQIVAESSFKAMQENPMTNLTNYSSMDFNISKFIRNGKVGDWKNHFSEEQQEYVDYLYEKNYVANGLLIRDS